MAVYQAYNLYFPQDPCNTRSCCSDIAEEDDRIATNHQMTHTNKNVICPRISIYVLLPYISQHSRKHTLWMAPEANKPQERF